MPVQNENNIGLPTDGLRRLLNELLDSKTEDSNNNAAAQTEMAELQALKSGALLESRRRQLAAKHGLM